MGEVKVYGVWFSPYSLRVEIALKIKGVEYEYIEEDLFNKSEELLKYNPVHKKIPILVHNGKPIVESSTILEYIDETWKDNPLLPSDPIEKAQARFWTKFIDEKLMPAMRIACLIEGENERERAKEEAAELLELLENEIKENKFLGGIGKGIKFLSLAAIPLGFTAPIYKEVSNVELLTKDKYPAVWAWIKEVMDYSVIKEKLPHREKMLEHYHVFYPFLRARFNGSK